ncbi:MAG: DUF1624 domain-containing protein [Pseudomonadales bacterium]|nr:DUF1624 domain-containing protein [Pseudomonadales bacterium]
MDKANSTKANRVFGIDLARGTAALMLASVHTVWIYAAADAQETSVGIAVHTIGQATCAFLITMGFSFIITKHQSINYALKRAFLIFIAGYILNTFKFIIPIVTFGTMPESFIKAYGWHYPLNNDQLLYLFLTGDILQMAGISFAIAGLIRKFIKNKYLILILALCAIGLYTQVKGYRPGITGIDYLCDLLWGSQWNVYFPVFPWISNILIGMFMGMIYQSSKETSGEGGLYKGTLILGPASLIVGAALCYYDWEYHFNNFFHSGPGGMLLAVGTSLCFFYFYAKILTKPLQNKAWFRNAMLYLSSRVTSIYFIQWTIICWGMGIFGYQTLGLDKLLILMPTMTCLTLVVDYVLLKATQNIKLSNNYHQAEIRS